VLAKQVGELSKKLQLTTHDANLTQLNVIKLQESQSEKGAEVEGKAEELRSLQEQMMALDQSLAAKQQVERVFHVHMRTQSKVAERLTLAARGEGAPPLPANILNQRISEAKETESKLFSVVEALMQEHPKHAPLLSQVVQAVGAASS